MRRLKTCVLYTAISTAALALFVGLMAAAYALGTGML